MELPVPCSLTWLKNHPNGLLWPPSDTAYFSIHFTVWLDCLGHLTPTDYLPGKKPAIRSLPFPMLLDSRRTYTSLPNPGSWACHCSHFSPCLTLSWAVLAISQLPNSLCGKQAPVSRFTYPQTLHCALLWGARSSSAGIRLGSEMRTSHCCHDASPLALLSSPHGNERGDAPALFTGPQLLTEMIVSNLLLNHLYGKLELWWGLEVTRLILTSFVKCSLAMSSAMF